MLSLLTSLRSFWLGNELDELLLPYEIDLSIKSHIRNEELLEHIERVGQIFWERAPE